MNSVLKNLNYVPSTALDDVLVLPLALPLLIVRFRMPWGPRFANLFAFDDLEGAGDTEGFPIRSATSSEMMKRLLCKARKTREGGNRARERVASERAREMRSGRGLAVGVSKRQSSL